jgi:hypothetical protein
VRTAFTHECELVITTSKRSSVSVDQAAWKNGSSSFQRRCTDGFSPSFGTQTSHPGKRRATTSGRAARVKTASGRTKFAMAEATFSEPAICIVHS